MLVLSSDRPLVDWTIRVIHTTGRPTEMIAVEEHLAELLALAAPLPSRELALLESLGAVVKGDLVAAQPMPAFDNSAMDGYAVRAADIASTPATLPVAADLAAGDVLQGDLPPGSAARIMTGAAVPGGADCVVPVEDTDGGTEKVQINATAAAGSCIRRAGDDARPGDVLLRAGERVGPAQAGLAAASGTAKLTVTPLPSVVVVSTGAELQPPGTEIGAGKIFDSNGTTLAALARASGLTTTMMPCHTDDPAQFTATIDAAAGTADLVLTTGGVSAGAFEVVKQVLGQRDGFVFRKVAMQPGKPQGFGKIGSSVVLNLPGNAVSAVVSFMIFGRPVIARMADQSEDALFGRRRQARLAQAVDRRPVRQFLRGTWDEAAGQVAVSPARGSHMLAGLARANCLVVVLEGAGEAAAGTDVDVIPLPA